jgi:hypothetical protein
MKKTPRRRITVTSPLIQARKVNFIGFMWHWALFCDFIGPSSQQVQQSTYTFLAMLLSKKLPTLTQRFSYWTFFTFFSSTVTFTLQCEALQIFVFVEHNTSIKNASVFNTFFLTGAESKPSQKM